MFHDRKEAGLALAQKLLHYKDVDGVVLAVPRGGVPVAYEVAKMLHLPLEIILSKKIGHPAHKEFAIGAVSLTGRIIDPDIYVPEEYIEQETRRIRMRLKDMYKKYMGDKDPTDIKDKIVILIDDGIATGNTLLSTIQMLKNNKPKKIVVAVPVASPSAAKKIKDQVDEFISLLVPDNFYAVGQFYENFQPVSDEEVISLLNKLKVELAKAS
jgi:putative phosphoribosyl transferase